MFHKFISTCLFEKNTIILCLSKTPKTVYPMEKVKLRSDQEMKWKTLFRAGCQSSMAGRQDVTVQLPDGRIYDEYM